MAFQHCQPVSEAPDMCICFSRGNQGRLRRIVGRCTLSVRRGWSTHALWGGRREWWEVASIKLPPLYLEVIGLYVRCSGQRLACPRVFKPVWSTILILEERLASVELSRFAIWAFRWIWAVEVGDVLISDITEPESTILIGIYLTRLLRSGWLTNECYWRLQTKPMQLSGLGHHPNARRRNLRRGRDDWSSPRRPGFSRIPDLQFQSSTRNGRLSIRSQSYLAPAVESCLSTSP